MPMLQRIKKIEEILQERNNPNNGLTIFVYDYSDEVSRCFSDITEYYEFVKWLEYGASNELKNEFDSILTIINNEVVNKYIDTFRNKKDKDISYGKAPNIIGMDKVIYDKYLAQQTNT
jgi:hypothetical protein